LSRFLCPHLLFPPISGASVVHKAFALQSSETVLEPDDGTVTEGKTGWVTWDTEMAFQCDGSAVPLFRGLETPVTFPEESKKNPKCQSLSLLGDRHCLPFLYIFLHFCLPTPVCCWAPKRARHTHILQLIFLTLTANLKYWFWRT